MQTNIMGSVLGQDWTALSRFQLVALAREALAELESRDDEGGLEADIALIDAPLEILQRYFD